MRWLLLNRYRRIVLSWFVCSLVLYCYELMFQYGVFLNHVARMQRLQYIVCQLLGGNRDLRTIYMNQEWQAYVSFGLTSDVFNATIVLGCFGSIWWLSKQLDPERLVMRCRECKHVLSGITEPRCPECGEWI